MEDRKMDILCQNCSKVLYDYQRGLACDYCGKWYHSECEKIGVEYYRYIANCEQLWFCSRCIYNASPLRLNEVTPNCQVIISKEEEIRARKFHEKNDIQSVKAADSNLNARLRARPNAVSRKKDARTRSHNFKSLEGDYGDETNQHELCILNGSYNKLDKDIQIEQKNEICPIAETHKKDVYHPILNGIRSPNSNMIGKKNNSGHFSPNGYNDINENIKEVIEEEYIEEFINPALDDVPVNHHLRVENNFEESCSSTLSGPHEISVKNWFKSLKKDVYDNEIFNDPARIFSCNQLSYVTMLKVIPFNSANHISHFSWKDIHEIPQENEKCVLTLVLTMSAAGEFAVPFFVTPTVREKLSIFNVMTADVLYKYIEEGFISYLNSNNIKRPVLLFLDSIVSSISQNVIELCKMNEIIVYSLLPEFAHILEPGMVGVFDIIKHHWNKLLRDSKSRVNIGTIKKDMNPLLKIILDQIPPESVIDAFKETGLYPFNPHIAIVKHFEAFYPETALVPNEQDYQSALKVLWHEIGHLNILKMECSHKPRELWKMWRKIKSNAYHSPHLPNSLKR